ncbi:MAG: GTP-binding protein [Mastigocoleus sp. MO_167.B18]|nr:GTP-binding protein [Mastigocoleus sp. MO_167.B18]
MTGITKYHKHKTPVTIITGFLGSGKTTTMNHILTNRQNLKIAVLVNEFGDINIDSQLLVSVDRDMVQLSNGCICCTINASLINAVNQVLEHQDIDYIVIETTGLAEPVPLMMTFLSSQLSNVTRLDSILTVVDAESFINDSFGSDNFGSEIALNQIIYGDIILLNKTDLVTETKLQYIENYIHSIKSGARILRTQYGQVALPLILDVGNNTAKNLTSTNLNFTSLQHNLVNASHVNRLKENDFMSVSFQSDRPLVVEKFMNFLDEQLPETVFRAKGIIWYQGSKLRHIFQLSGKRCNFQRDKWKDSPSNQLVFIGRNLDANKIKNQLEQCLATN